MNYKNIFFLTHFFVMSCAFTPNKHELNLSTSKQAKVTLINSKKETVEELGQTPLNISFKQLNELNDDNDWINLVVSASGFVTENIVINSNARTSVDMKIKLHSIEWWNDPSSSIPSQLVNQIGRNIQKAYQLIRQSKLDEAYSSVEKLSNQYPQAAFFHDLKGSILLLQGKKNAAVSSFERSLQISSDNPETVQILKDIKKQGD